MRTLTRYAGFGELEIRGFIAMSHLNMNNIINATLLVGAILSGFILTNRAKEKDEPPERNDIVGKVHPEPIKSKSSAEHFTKPPG